MNQGKELPIIQKTYDLIKWYVPILQKLPRNHRFQLGDRAINGLYDFLEALIVAQYQRDKLAVLQTLNSKLDVLRYQTRLLFEFNLLSTQRYTYVGELIDGIGVALGGWIKQQQTKQNGASARRQQLKPILKSVLA